MQNHHWRGVDLRHLRHEMADCHIGGHGDGLLGRHADHDIVERIHIFLVLDPVTNWRRFLTSPVTPLHERPDFERESRIGALRPARCQAISRWSPRRYSDAGLPTPAAYASASWTVKSLRSAKPGRHRRTAGLCRRHSRHNVQDYA